MSFLDGDYLFRAPKVSRGIEIAKVLVGTDEKEYTIHKDLLCKSSAFFERALDGHFSEAQTKTIRLPEDEPDIFNILVDWLYTGSCTFDDKCYALLEAQRHTPVDLCWLKVYRMADRMLLPGLQYIAVARIKYTFNSNRPFIPSNAFINSLFDSNGVDPPMLQMYIVHHVIYWLPKSVDKTQWSRLFKVQDRFGAEVAVVMAHGGTWEVDHPDRDAFFDTNLAFDHEGLGHRGRERDECATVPPPENELYTAVLSKLFSPGDFGDKRMINQYRYQRDTTEAQRLESNSLKIMGSHQHGFGIVATHTANLIRGPPIPLAVRPLRCNTLLRCRSCS